MKWLLLVAVAGALALAHGVARADDGAAVALLPLDADSKLELYGQPVASEVARALVAGGIDVVVVGPKMAVPERARLIVDGKISAGKGDAVVLALRIRDRDTGSVLDSVSSTAAALTSIDQAAADVSARVLPAVRARLAAHATRVAASATALAPAQPAQPAQPRGPAPPIPMLVALGAGTTAGEPLRLALTEATDAWLRVRHREPRATPLPSLAQPFAVSTLGKQHVAAALAIEVLAYTVEPGVIPLARARVHVRIADAEHDLFDRVIATDTIVGDRDQAPARLAERVATEVLAILTPNAARALPGLAAP
jgi:hypothetical protein